MEGNLILAVGLIIIGIAVLASGFVKVKGLKKVHPLLAIGGAILFVVAGMWAGGYIDVDLGTETAEVANVCADFDITPSVGAGNGQLNSAEDRITVGYYANTTAHTIAENDNTSWVDTSVTFEIRPEPFTGADADDLATLYYTVTNPDQTVSTAESSDKYMVTKSSGYRQLVWTGDGTNYIEGSTTMLMTGNETLYLAIDTAQTDMSYIQNELDSEALIVVFSNGCGWSETFTVEFTCINQHN